MSKVMVYGASDDLIEVEGDIEEEFYALGDDKPNLLAFSDGTLLEVTYTDSGFWRINAISRNTSTQITKHEGADADVDYSDRVTLDGFITWVVHGKSMKRARQPVDA